MHIWIDADACPTSVRETVFRASKRCGLQVTVVANQSIGIPQSGLIDSVVVADGADVADKHIVAEMDRGDLVITADIPLADEVVSKGGLALDPRGELFDKETIGARLAMRNLMDELRGGGLETGGPSAFTPKDLRAFANQLDRLLQRRDSQRE